jgi:hypothetical protein
MLRSKTTPEIGIFQTIRAGCGFRLAAAGLGRYILRVRAATDNVEAVRAGRPGFQAPAVIGGTPRSGLEHRSFCDRSIAKGPGEIHRFECEGLLPARCCMFPHDGRQGCGPLTLPVRYAHQPERPAIIPHWRANGFD